MHVSAIVLAAGKGLRLKSRVSKALIKINSCPPLAYCLKALSRHPYIKDIILVVNQENFKGIFTEVLKYRIRKIKDVVLGGRERRDSVIKGLRAIDGCTDLVLIHDGVRPFIDKDTLTRVIKEAVRCGAAIVGVPVKATIKEVVSCQFSVVSNPTVKKTLNRDNLWEVQTPQVFKKDLILKAYNKFKEAKVTDDASLVEKLGVKVNIVKGSYFNIKITTPEDLILAKAIAKCHTE